MATKQLTPVQIEQLYKFTLDFKVDYYDLQTELTDHLANAIEAQWQQNPGLPFTEALAIEYKKFGFNGFETIVAQRKQALNKKYNTLIWHYFRQFFTVPKIALTVLMIVTTFKILRYESLLFIAMIALLALTVLIITVLRKGVYGKKVKDTGKRWLLEEIIFNCGGIAAYIGLFFQLFNFVVRDNAGTPMLWILSVVFVLAALASYVILFAIPARAEEHLKTTYPEYNL